MGFQKAGVLDSIGDNSQGPFQLPVGLAQLSVQPHIPCSFYRLSLHFRDYFQATQSNKVCPGCGPRRQTLKWHFGYESPLTDNWQYPSLVGYSLQPEAVQLFKLSFVVNWDRILVEEGLVQYCWPLRDVREIITLRTTQSGGCGCDINSLERQQ